LEDGLYLEEIAPEILKYIDYEGFGKWMLDNYDHHFKELKNGQIMEFGYEPY